MGGDYLEKVISRSEPRPENIKSIRFGLTFDGNGPIPSFSSVSLHLHEWLFAVGSSLLPSPQKFRRYFFFLCSSLLFLVPNKQSQHEMCRLLFSQVKYSYSRYALYLSAQLAGHGRYSSAFSCCRFTYMTCATCTIVSRVESPAKPRCIDSEVPIYSAWFGRFQVCRAPAGPIWILRGVGGSGTTRVGSKWGAVSDAQGADGACGACVMQSKAARRAAIRGQTKGTHCHHWAWRHLPGGC